MALKLPNNIKNIFPQSRIDSEGIGSQKSKTQIWTCGGTNFVPSGNGYTYNYELADIRLHITTIAGDENVMAPVFLPQGAVISSVKVFGETVARTWLLARRKVDISAAAETMATANINTEDTTISNAIIDNENYAYTLQTEVQNGDDVYGARIEYVI